MIYQAGRARPGDLSAIYLCPLPLLWPCQSSTHFRLYNGAKIWIDPVSGAQTLRLAGKEVFLNPRGVAVVQAGGLLATNRF